MKLHQILAKKNILFYDDQKSKDEILKDLLHHLWQNTNLKNEEIREEELFRGLLERENEQTTGIGGGFGFPHARISNLHGSYFLLAISKSGLDYDSLDGNPVNYLVMSIVPRLQPAILLSFRAALISILMKDNNTSEMMKSDAAAVHTVIKNENKSLEDQILAKDIMKPVVCSLKPEMTLFEAARELHTRHAESMPVIDANGKLLGKLSCHDLFSYKLPQFFSTLHSISFIKYMNPFEKYFESDQTDTLGSLEFKEKTPKIKPDATLMEIIFHMTVKNNELLYVVEDGTLLGTIDRYSIIDKILVSGINGEQL